MNTKINPKWSKTWKRWEVPDDDNGMRGLAWSDIEDMADEYVESRGYEPGINEDFVDRVAHRLARKYKIKRPLPSWAKSFLAEYEIASEVCKPSPESVEDMLRKHAPIA